MTTARYSRTDGDETFAPDPSSPRRLLAGWSHTRQPAGLAAHLTRYGSVPLERYAGGSGRERLLAAVDASGLRGRGGAGFPTGRKLRAVAQGRRPVVVANGCEANRSARRTTHC